MAAPSGGFAAIGSSLGSGVPVKPAGRRRTAGGGREETRAPLTLRRRSAAGA